MNLTGIYEKLTTKEKDFLVKVWNEQHRGIKIDLATLPFIKLFDAIRYIDVELQKTRQFQRTRRGIFSKEYDLAVRINALLSKYLVKESAKHNKF